MELNDEKNFTLVDSNGTSTLAFLINEPENGTNCATIQKLEHVYPDSSNVFKKKYYINNSKEGEEYNILLLTIQKDKAGIADNAVSLAVPGIEIYIPFNELVDIAVEIERLEKEKLTYQNEINRVNKMLSNEGFVAKAPAAKIEEEKAKKAKYEELLAKTEERISALK